MCNVSNDNDSSNLKLRPGAFHLLWCSDACNMALNREFSFANRAAGLSNSKIWKWKIEHRWLPAYKSAPAYPFRVQRTYKIKAQFGNKYSKLTDFPWEEYVSNQNFKYQPKKLYMLHTFLFMEHCLEKNQIVENRPNCPLKLMEDQMKILETNSNIRRIAAISLYLENVFQSINDNILQW